MNAAVRKYWDEFCKDHPSVDASTPFQTWHFGIGREDAAELVTFVLAGRKIATAALPCEFEAKPEYAPIIGGYSVVTDFDGDPKCVIRTTEIRVIPFNEVDADFAFDEGEGDQSVEFWRRVHWDYFTRRCADLGTEMTAEMPVICERFELLYPKPALISKS